MKTCILLGLLAVAFLECAGCTQPAVGTPGYHDPYGATAGESERHWWGEERDNRDVDLDRFLHRWRGLTE
jgi:hypothetical protein